MKYYIGHPDNPLSRAEKLFPRDILIEFNGGLEKIEEKIEGMNLVEIHFQLFEELPFDVFHFEILKKYANEVRGAGIEIIAHAPFLKDKNIDGEKYMPLNFDFVWPVVPSEYRKKRVMKIGENECFVRKAKGNDFIRLIKILGELKIPAMTMHATKSGIVLNDRDWKDFLRFLKEFKLFADKNNVLIAVETGGLHEEHIKDIIKLGCRINFDSAHYFLDMHYLGKNADEANELTIKAYEKFADNIEVLHLSQTLLNYDSHLGLLDKKGILTCNEEILKIAKEKGCSKYIILETKPDKDAIEHVKKIVG